MRFLATQPIAVEPHEIQAIIDAAVRIAKRVPWRIEGPREFFDAISAYGCEVDGDRVHIPPAVVDRVMGRADPLKGRGAPSHLW